MTFRGTSNVFIYVILIVFKSISNLKCRKTVRNTGLAILTDLFDVLKLSSDIYLYIALLQGRFFFQSNAKLMSWKIMVSLAKFIQISNHQVQFSYKQFYKWPVSVFSSSQIMWIQFSLIIVTV